MQTPEYFEKYKTLKFERDDDGVLVVRLHSDDGEVDYQAIHHSEWMPAFTDVAMDRDNRVVVITGTGDSFLGEHGAGGVAAPDLEKRKVPPSQWDVSLQRQKLLIDRLLEIDVPVIGAINGAVRLHAELVLLSDVTLAAEHTVFADIVHWPTGEPANDGAHVLWIELLGINRAKYFLMTGHEISAQEALTLGLVNEVWPKDELMPRALEIAHQLATYNEMALRYQRRAFADRWKHLFMDHYGTGVGMMTEAMYYMNTDLEHVPGSHKANSAGLRPMQPKRDR